MELIVRIHLTVNTSACGTRTMQLNILMKALLVRQLNIKINKIANVSAI